MYILDNCIRQGKLNHYFSNYWTPRTHEHYLTGIELAKKIAPGETVLDVGCGTNYFKAILGERVYGIDPVFEEADEKTTIEEFRGGEYDVIFALGSINFGKYSVINAQIGKLLTHLKPGGRIYWRQNPGRFDHNNEHQYSIEFFPWSIEYNVQLSCIHNCEVRHFEWENNSRIYCEWWKK